MFVTEVLIEFPKVKCRSVRVHIFIFRMIRSVYIVFL